MSEPGVRPDYSDSSPVFTFSAGPSGASPRTLAAIGKGVPYHHDPLFLDLYASTMGRLQQAFGAPERPVILQGEAVLGLEAAAASLIGRGDVVLNLVSGIFGKGFGYWARRYAKEVIEVEVAYDSAVSASQVESALAARPDVAIVSVVHCETPSGTMNPVAEVGPVAAAAGALLLVDAVSSFGGMVVEPRAWQADLIVAGPHKCLGGAPGLSLLYVSDKAWEHMEANPEAPRASVLSILDWKDVDGRSHPFPFTPSVVEIQALDSCLHQYLEEGPAAVRARHARAARATRAGGAALGLSLWAADPSICSDTATAFKVPEGIDEPRLRAQARSQLGVMLSGGEGDLAGKVTRIGHMGPGAYPIGPVVALTALGQSLRSQGFAADVGGAVEAAVAALNESD
jgi:pyridoxamine---pyruvate transaminase